MLDLAQSYGSLSETLRREVLAKIDDEFGLEIPQLYIVNVSVPAEVERALDARASMRAIGDLAAYQAYQLGNAMPEAAARAAEARLQESTGAHTSAIGELQAARKSEEERSAQVVEAEARVSRAQADLAAAGAGVGQVEEELVSLLGEGDPDQLLASRRAESEGRERAAEEARSKEREARRQHDLAIEAE